MYLLPQRIPRSENEEEKRLSTSYSKRTGISHQQATDGFPKHSHLLDMHDVRGSATCMSMEENPPAFLSEPGFVCGRVRNSEADRVPKSRGQVSSRWVAQPCTACLLDSAQLLAECPKGTPSCVLPPVTVCYP
jgi:hypothetical protein